MATNPSTARGSDAWRAVGGSRPQTRDLRVANLVTDTLSIRDSILGNLAIDGTLTVDELHVSGGGGASVGGTMHMLDDMQVDGTALFGGDVTVSGGDLDVRGSAAVAGALALGDPDAAAVSAGEARPFLWSDGRGGVALNSVSAADFYHSSVSSGSAAPLPPLPAALCVSTSDALACPLVAATRRQAGRSVLVLAGRARGAGVAALADAGAATGAAAAGARAALQFFAGTGAAPAAGASSAAPRARADAHDHDRPGAEFALDGGPGGAGALGVSARRIVLRAPAVALSRGRAAAATAAGTAAPDSTDLDTAMDVDCDDDVAALDAVARAPRPIAQTYQGKLERFNADPWNERALPGLLRTDLVLRAQQKQAGDDFMRGGPARPLLVGAPLRASAPAAVAGETNEDDVPGLAFLFAGARRGPDGHVGWRFGGGPAIDPDTLAGDENGGGGDGDGGAGAAAAATRAPALVSGGAFVASAPPASSAGGGGRATHKRSAAQAGFLEPGLGPESLAHFVPVLTQTQAPSRMRNRATVAVNAPLAPADNRAALLVNGPTHLQSLDAAPLNLNTPFRLACDSAAAAAGAARRGAAYGVAAHWDSAALPDQDPRFGPTNGQFGVVVGGRRVGRGYFRSSSSSSLPPSANLTGPDPENAREPGAFRYVAYVTVDGGQTWAESAEDFVEASTATSSAAQSIGADAFFAPVVCGPRTAIVHDGRGFAFATKDRGASWFPCAVLGVSAGLITPPDGVNVPPRLVYVAPPTRNNGGADDKHRVFSTGTPAAAGGSAGAAPAVLLASPALTIDETVGISPLSSPIELDFAPTGMAGGVVALGSGSGSGGGGGSDDVIALVLFNPTVNFLQIARADNYASAADGGNVEVDTGRDRFTSSIMPDDGSSGFCAAAVSAVRVGDIVAAGVCAAGGGSGGGSGSGNHMVVAVGTFVSRDYFFWTECVAVPADQLPPGFRPGTLAWLSPHVIVALADDDSGNLGVSADRGRSWRFLAGPAAGGGGGLDLRLLRRCGLGAVLGPAALRPRLLGLFRSSALPHDDGDGNDVQTPPLPPAVLVCAAADGSADARADAATPAARDAGVAAAYALALDSLAPRRGAGAGAGAAAGAPVLLRVAGSAAVEGDCRVDGDLRIGSGVQGDLRDDDYELDIAQRADGQRRSRRRLLLVSGASIEPEGVDVLDAGAELCIGTAALVNGNRKTVRIGRAGDSVVIEGQVVQAGGAAQVVDRTIVLNSANGDDGVAVSGNRAGMRVREVGDGDDAGGGGRRPGGFVRTAPAPVLPTTVVAQNDLTNDTIGWDLKAPGSATVARLALDTLATPAPAAGALLLWESAGGGGGSGSGSGSEVSGVIVARGGALLADNLALLRPPGGDGGERQTFTGPLSVPAGLSAGRMDVTDDNNEDGGDGGGAPLRVLVGDLLVASGALVALGTAPGAGVRASTVSAGLVSADLVSAATVSADGVVAALFRTTAAGTVSAFLVSAAGVSADGVSAESLDVTAGPLRVLVGDLLVNSGALVAMGTAPGAGVRASTVSASTVSAATVSAATVSADGVGAKTLDVTAGPLRVLVGDLLVTSGALVALGSAPGAGVRASTVSAGLVSAATLSAGGGAVGGDLEVRGSMIALGGGTGGIGGANHAGVGVRTNGTVSAHLVSANSVRAGGAVSADTLSGNTLCGGTVRGDKLSGNTLSGGTLSGNTVSGNTVAAANATVQSALSKGGSAGAVDADPYFSVSGAAHSSFALFHDGLAATMLGPLGKSRSGRAYIGGGDFAGAIGGAGTADGGGLRFVDLTAPTAEAAANTTAHQWLTNQGGAQGVAGLLALAALTKTGSLRLLRPGAQLVVAGAGGAVSAETLSATSVKCGDSVSAGGTVSGQTLRAGTGGVLVAAGGAVDCALLRNGAAGTAPVTVSGGLTVSSAATGGLTVTGGGGVEVTGGGGLSAATLALTGGATVTGALTAASVAAGAITLTGANATFSTATLRGTTEVSGTLVRGGNGSFSSTVSAARFDATGSAGFNGENVYCTRVNSNNADLNVYVQGLRLGVETISDDDTHFSKGSTVLVMNYGAERTYQFPKAGGGTFFIFVNARHNVSAFIQYLGTSVRVNGEDVSTKTVRLGPGDIQIAFVGGSEVLYVSNFNFLD